MNLDLELYRREVRVSSDPLVRLSAIDVAPDHPRKTFVFVHGFGGEAEQWQHQIQHFLIENRVIALDLRGHGLSDRPRGGYDMPQILQDIDRALGILNVKGEICLVGHSFGGAIVTDYAHAHPDRVERLVLIATAGEFKLAPVYAIGLQMNRWLQSLAGYVLRSRLHAPPHALRALYRDYVSTWRGWDTFQQLQVPTLVIRGHRDRVFERAYFEDVPRCIPGAEEVDIPGSGHLVMLERREAVNRAIERFVGGEEHRSWREGGGQWSATEAGLGRRSVGRAALRNERPWLAHYELGVPYTTAVPNIPLHHLLRSAVRRFPRHPAIFFEGSRISYRKLNHDANRLANALRGLNVEKGTRVALLLPNVPQMVIAFYATLKTGAAVVLVPPVIEPAEVMRQVKEAEPTVLITLTTWAGLALQVQQGAQVPHVVLASPLTYLPWPKRILGALQQPELDVPNGIDWSTFLSGQSDKSPDVQVEPDDLAVIQYTGGTTIQARGVMLSHRNLVANAMQTRHWMSEAVEGRERFLSIVPFFHSYGMTTAMNVPIALGAGMILKSQFQTHKVLKAIKRYRPTIFAGVPSMYVALVNFRGVRRYGIASVKTCISGSEALPVEVQEAFEKLTRGHLVEGYGLTEASPVTHANPLAVSSKPGTIGVPLPSTEAAIFKLERRGVRVRQGQIGELAVRGPQIMIGYWKDADATAKAIDSEGWLFTGDIAQQDADGYFRIVSRKADMWYPTRPGKPAFPRDVEEVIYEIPQVKEVTVVGIASHPFAFVITGVAGPTADAVIAYCKRRLPPALVPRFVIFMDDFPRTFMGKVLRRELAGRFQEHRPM